MVRQDYLDSRVEYDPNTGCYLWSQSTDSSGYGCAWDGQKLVGAHKFAWETKFGAVPQGMCVCHRCDTPRCCNTDHMFLGTHHDNMKDRAEKGRFSPKGEANSRSKLNLTQVNHIKYSDLPNVRLAEIYKISASQIGKIKNGKSW